LKVPLAVTVTPAKFAGADTMSVTTKGYGSNPRHLFGANGHRWFPLDPAKMVA
jgi:hypothetical protein